MSEVTELIKAFRDGALTLDQVAERFRAREWPSRQRPSPTTFEEGAAAAEQDPEPDLPGSFDEVYAAYDRRELTKEEFRTLKAAALEAMNSDTPTPE